MTRLKQQEGGDLLIFGHGLLGETLLRAQLTDVIDLSVPNCRFHRPAC